MLVSPATNDYSTSKTPSSSASQSLRVRIRTLNVCEPSFPSRDVVRQENYARRKAQEFQGWACPRTIPYQNIGPAHVPPQTPKPIINDRPTNVTSAKPASRQASNGNVSNRPKSTSVVQDEHLMRAQFEENFRRLQSANQEHLKKSSYILRHVQLGRGVKDILEKYSRDSSRMKSADINGLPSVKGDEKEQSVLHDRLRDDFDEEDDEIEVSTVSGIRDDIMSPRTTIHSNVMSIYTTETSGSNKHHPVEMSIIPMKLSQSAPPMKRNKIPQETLRLFTPYYSDLSETLRLEEKKLIRDKLYRQLCCILWLLRRMGRPEWQESISGCWNIAQWRTTDPGPHNQPIKKTQESIKTHGKKTPRSEDKSVSTTKTPKENTLSPVRTTSVPVHKSRKKPNSTNESSMTHLRRTSLDSQSESNTLDDATERLYLTINSVNIDSDLNESISSTTDSTNLYSYQQLINPPLTTTNSIDPTTNTSRTSLSSNFSQPIGHRVSARLTAIMERQQRRRSPDVLLKKWIERQTITKNNSDQPPLAEKELRLLRVGDTSDLNRIFGLENATSTNKEQVRVRETREIERKLVTNVKQRPATSVGFTQAKLHAQALYKIRRDFNEFNEEQSTILNNKLEQADNSRLFYYQTKLDLVQKTMLPNTKSSEKDKPVVIIDRLFRKMRFDKAKKEENAVYLKYQPWYVDLSKMIQKEYKDDYIIILLLNEIEKFADPLHKPTDIRFKAILRKLQVHEICHPDILAAIEFIRVHVMRMKKGELKRFFHKQFPTVTIYVKKSSDNEDDDDSEDDDDNEDEDDDDSDETICEP